MVCWFVAVLAGIRGIPGVDVRGGGEVFFNDLSRPVRCL